MLIENGYSKINNSFSKFFFKNLAKKLNLTWTFDCDLSMEGKLVNLRKLSCVDMVDYKQAAMLFNSMRYKHHFVFESYNFKDSKAPLYRKMTTAWKIKVKNPAKLCVQINNNVPLKNKSTCYITSSFAKHILEPFYIPTKTRFYKNGYISLKHNSNNLFIYSYSLYKPHSQAEFAWFTKHIELFSNKYLGNKYNKKFLKKAKSFPVNYKFLNSILDITVKIPVQHKLIYNNLFYELACNSLREQNTNISIYYKYLQISSFVEKNQAAIINYLSCLYFGLGDNLQTNHDRTILEYKRLLDNKCIRPGTISIIIRNFPLLKDLHKNKIRLLNQHNLNDPNNSRSDIGYHADSGYVTSFCSTESEDSQESSSSDNNSKNNNNDDNDQIKHKYNFSTSFISKYIFESKTKSRTKLNPSDNNQASFNAPISTKQKSKSL